MDTQRAVIENFAPNHEDAVNIEGLEDLFQWASEMVADEYDPRARRGKEQRIRRNVLGLIQQSKEVEARDKYSEEISVLQRRVIALLQIINEKMEENSSLKQILIMQYVALGRVAQLEDELKQLQAMTWYREEAEAERKHLMDALAKVKKERDFLEEVVTVAETENERLSRLFNEAKNELYTIKNRRWWQPLVQLFTRVTA